MTTPSNEELPILIRKAISSDIPFIFSSWLKSYRNSEFARSMTSTIYFTEHHKVVERLLRGCEVFVACSTKDDADIYGYICGERVDGIFVLHYIFVKHTYRRLGIARELLNQFEHNPETASIYTHHSQKAAVLADKFRMVHSPYLALTPDYRREALNVKEKGEIK